MQIEEKGKIVSLGKLIQSTKAELDKAFSLIEKEKSLVIGRLFLHGIKPNQKRIEEYVSFLAKAEKGEIKCK